MTRILRVLALALLSAVTVEFLLGDQWLGGAAPLGQQFAQLVLFTAFYGSTALLIREVARRTGRGWPTILVLAAAFGVIEEGIVDQSLFNPDFAGQRLLDDGWIPALGIAGPWTVFVIAIHVIFSMGAPIAIAEALFPDPIPGRGPVAPQRQGPWLGVGGLIAASTLLVLGGGAIWFVTTVAADYQASPWQLGASALIGLALVVGALRLPRRAPRERRPVLPAAIVGLTCSSALMLTSRAAVGGFAWITTALELIVLLAGVIVATRFRADVTGLAVGAVLTYCWVGIGTAASVGGWPIVEQVLIVAVLLAVVAIALTRRRRADRGAESVAAATP